MNKTTAVILTGILLCLAQPTRAGQDELRMGENHPFISKGDISLALQGSYFDISGSNASVLLLLQNLNASGSYFGISPYFIYSYRDNRSIGLRLKYSTASGSLGALDLDLPGSGMELSASDCGANSVSFNAELFHRSYWGLDERGRFGLFLDLALQYRSSLTGLKFSGDSSEGTTHTRSLGAKILARPGLEIFVMNNVSSIFSIGIGGLSYSISKNIKDGQVCGSKISSGARIMPDLTDISMGIAIHF